MGDLGSSPIKPNQAEGLGNYKMPVEGCYLLRKVMREETSCGDVSLEVRVFPTPELV